MPTMGLQEEEVCQAARTLRAGIPCLALFHGALAKTERGDVYDSFAESLLCSRYAMHCWLKLNDGLCCYRVVFSFFCGCVSS